MLEHRLFPGEMRTVARLKAKTSLLEDFLVAEPSLRPQIYFKNSLTALSHAMEDQILAIDNREDPPLVIANFQKERFYRMEARRYQRISSQADQVFILAAPETEFFGEDTDCHLVALDANDPLAQEWHLIILSRRYAAVLVCREEAGKESWSEYGQDTLPTLDPARRFRGVWSFDRKLTWRAASLILPKILDYRPDCAEILENHPMLSLIPGGPALLDPTVYTERLFNYLQAGQYKLVKTIKVIQGQERKERLVNRITSMVRSSLDPQVVLQLAVQELGEALHASRCLLYQPTGNGNYIIRQEFRATDVDSLVDYQENELSRKSLIELAVQRNQVVTLGMDDSGRSNYPPEISGALSADHLVSIKEEMQAQGVQSWLVAPVIFQEQNLGALSLQQTDGESRVWTLAEIELVRAVADQLGVALIQAEAYRSLQQLNQQLKSLDKARSDLITVTTHELRTPLTTLRVCLETLQENPDMEPSLRQQFLDTALQDSERLRELVEDFLILSRLEAGRVRWQMEKTDLKECFNIALSSMRRREVSMDLKLDIAADLPPVWVDRERLTEVLIKLLDNAVKFSKPPHTIEVSARAIEGAVELCVRDYGRGIEEDRLALIFDAFTQAEAVMTRTTAGCGLGLTICHQIITQQGGRIWAESEGLDKGSCFHIVLPTAEPDFQEQAMARA
ncbi:MAG: DICT sensory domain-containing protein [Gloeobacterales cyanobacterium]